MTYQKLLQIASEKAIAYDKEESAAILLLEHVTNLKTNQLFLKIHEEVEADILNSFNEIFERYLTKNEPIQYLVGYSCFYGYDFIVNPSVLIPRFETEELVENILYRYDKYFKGQKVDVVDVATGSGCIAISLALEEKNMNVIATDISFEALDVARMNNEKLGANVKFYQGDMLEPVKDKKFDIFVSNPDNEPNIALCGGNDGMKFYRIILSGVRPLLKDKALICFEHGFDKKEEMLLLANEYFPECKVEVLKDLEGKDRMTFIYVGDFNE